MSIDITGLGAIATAASDIVNKFWPDKTQVEKDIMALQMQEVMNTYNLASGQIEVNKIEAASTNWFVAGWRPYIGWICGTGLGYQFLFMPLLNGIINAVWHSTPFIALDSNTLVTCLGGLLGLAGMRTYEKKTGVESNH